MEKILENKVAVVTGASRGIGRRSLFPWRKKEQL